VIKNGINILLSVFIVNETLNNCHFEQSEKSITLTHLSQPPDTNRLS